MKDGDVLFEDFVGSLIGGIDDFSYLGIYDRRDFVGVARLRLVVAPDKDFLLAAVVDVGQSRGHTPFGDHASCK